MARKHFSSQHFAGFVLVEIMIVVAVIGLLVAIGMPSLVKARKHSQARRAINDARMLDAAVSQWAQEQNKQDGDTVIVSEAATYLKDGKWPTYDILGHPYAIGKVGSNQVQLWWRTKAALADAGIDWGPY